MVIPRFPMFMFFLGVSISTLIASVHFSSNKASDKVLGIGMAFKLAKKLLWDGKNYEKTLTWPMDILDFKCTLLSLFLWNKRGNWFVHIAFSGVELSFGLLQEQFLVRTIRAAGMAPMKVILTPMKMWNRLEKKE